MRSLLLLLSLAAPAQGQDRTAVIRFSDLPRTVPGLQETDQVAQPPVPGSRKPAGGTLRPAAGSSAQPFRAQSAPEPAAPAPPVLNNFDALPEPAAGNRIPPDTMGAAGPNDLMVVLNTEVRVQTKAGAERDRRTVAAFWSAVNPGASSPFDPRVFYDEDSGRWFFVALAGPRAATSAILIGVSATNDPAGAWTLRAFDHDATDVDWFDYPQVGINPKWVAVAGSAFTVANDTYKGSYMYVFSKAALLAGGAVSPTRFPNAFEGGGFAIQPAITYGNEPTMYFAQSNSFDSRIRLFRMTGDVGSECFEPLPAATPCTVGLLDGFLNVLTSDPSVPDAAQPEGAMALDSGDNRMQYLVVRNGRLWATRTVGLPAGAPTRAAVAWHQINPAGPFVVQEGHVEDASGHYYYPSLAVDAQDNVVLGFSGSASAANRYAGGFYTGRKASDTPSTMRTPLEYRPGLAKYVKTLSGSRNRWGDYSATTPDPSEPGIFWTIQEYASFPIGSGATADRWGTWWAKVSPIANLTGPVTGLAATTVGTDRVDFNWSPTEEADSYDVLRGDCSTLIQNQAGTSISRTGLGANTGETICVKPRNLISVGSAASKSSATLAAAVAATAQTRTTSIDVTYGVVSSSGYVFDVSESSLFTGTVFSSRTANGNLGTLTVSGLSPATVYFMRIASLNSLGAANYVSLGSTRTDTGVKAPGAAAPSNAAVDALRANWTLNGNSIGLQYTAFASPSASFTGTVLSSTTFNLFADFTDLSPNTTYHFKVAAADGPETVLSTATTLARAPSDPSVLAANVRKSSATFTWSRNGNPVGTLFEAQASRASDFSAGTVSSMTRNASALLEGLDPNTVHYFRVRALDHDARPTSHSTATLTPATLAVEPSGAAYVAVTFSSATIRWDGYPSAPQSARAEGFRLEASENADFSGTPLSRTSASGSLSVLGIEGLEANTTYFLRIGALNPDGRASYTHLGSTRTSSIIASTVTVTNDSAVTVTVNPAAPEVQRVELDVPSGALPTGKRLRVNTSVALTLPPPVSNHASLTALGPNIGVDIDAEGAQPLFPVPLTFTYVPAALPAGREPRDIHIAFYDERGSIWRVLPTMVDVGRNTATALLPHFSLFAPFFVTPANNLETAQIFPVPWEPGAGGRFDAPSITFASLPAGARVKVFTVRAELVWQGEASSGGVLAWDGRNTHGLKVGSGTYLVSIEGAGSRTVKRVVVVR